MGLLGWLVAAFVAGAITIAYMLLVWRKRRLEARQAEARLRGEQTLTRLDKPK